MADPKDTKKTSAKVDKKKETVRERAEKATGAAPKNRRLKTGAKAASKPFRAVGKGVKKVTRPLGFLARPFKTRPARFVGRVLAAILLLRFIRNSWKEVRQVEWPTARETYRMTVAVFIFSVVFSILVGVLDFGLDKIFRKVFVD